MDKTCEIITKIKNAGGEAFIVGGYVRDRLLGIESQDCDIATNMTSERLVEVFRGHRVDTVGQSFQVVIVDGFEVATYRRDIYEDHKTVDVVVTDDIRDDLGRRDLTINSMAMDAFTFDVIDPFDGLKDLKKRRIRFTGDADKRIQEDPVRMLRACRFLAMIERSSFAVETFEAICRNSHLIQLVANERIRLEIVKAMKAKNAGNFFRALNNTGLLGYVFPCMTDSVNHWGGKFHNEDIFEHCCMACDNIPVNDYRLKIAAFLHDNGKPLAFKLNSSGGFQRHDKIGYDQAVLDLNRLKFSNGEIAYITDIIFVHMYNLNIDSTDRVFRRFLARCAEFKVDPRHVVLHIIADHDANLAKEPHSPIIFDQLMKRINDEIEKSNAFSVRDLAIGGREVMETLGISPSPMVGTKLKLLFERVLENPELNNVDDLMRMLKEMNNE